ncbi:MAG: SCO family protein [Deltaproteobacteria bacterium]|nr:SCO family protein [Deltaproteobacteria bacterium]
MKPKLTIVLLALLVCLLAIPAYTEEMKQNKYQGHQIHTAMKMDTDDDQLLNIDVQLHDLELMTQDRKRVKFKSEVIADKLVAMTFIYTTCTTVCPVYNTIFTQLQDLLGQRLGKDVVLVTMTLDPARDVPRRMKKEANKFGAKPGWIYLTGKKQNVDQVLRGLDAYFPDFTQHPPMAIVGDGKTGTWKRFNGFPQPEHLLAMIDELKAAR